ncbi:hypothetical protein FBQ97_00085 [Acidobacteria bacterium ACD]|nr:MAG: hypothetical protein EDX89_05545 [Acidobacteriota bacterium]MCE7956366.1 hypothetical protein [Acidobacteria bacterium ACB2]MDL1948203.1 hypothetical protein [Acidobacteria bacterium ACD]
MRLTLPSDLLRPAGEDAGAAPEAWLYGVLTINGVDHHIEAIAVTGVDGHQAAEAPALDESLDLYLEASAAERPFDTVAIGERRYVLFLTPFSASTWRAAPEEPEEP